MAARCSSDSTQPNPRVGQSELPPDEVQADHKQRFLKHQARDDHHHKTRDRLRHREDENPHSNQSLSCQHGRVAAQILQPIHEGEPKRNTPRVRPEGLQSKVR